MTPRKHPVIFIGAELHFRLVLNLRIVVQSEEPAKSKPSHCKFCNPQKHFTVNFT